MKLFRLALATLTLAAILWNCSKPTDLAGDVSETGNTFIAGRVIHQGGAAAQNTVVRLIEEGSIPGIPAETVPRTDTADANGGYRFDEVIPGPYNLEFYNDSAKTRGLHQGLIATPESHEVAPETLYLPGAILYPLGDSNDTIKAVHIPGTTFSATVVPSDLLRGFVILDSIPVSVISRMAVLLSSGIVRTMALPASYEISTGDTIAVQPSVLYRVRKAGVPVNVDGSLDEFAAVPAITLLSANGAQGDYRLLYDDFALYVGARVADRHLNAYNTVHDSFPQTYDDGIELMFDTRHDRPLRPQGDDFKLFVNINRAVEDSRGAGYLMDLAWTCVCSLVVHLNGTPNDSADTDSSYSIEIAIPWSSLEMAAPSPETDTLGFEAILNDRNTPPIADRAWSAWANTNGWDVIYDTTACRIWPETDCSPINDPVGWGNLIFLK